MSDLHDARVEAAAVAAINSHRTNAGLSLLDTLDDIPNANEWREDARAAIAAADALVTVEMIAEVLDSAYPYTVKHGGLRPAAESVLALLRGGEER